MAHLDRPYGDWIRSVTSTPADAMHLPEHGRLKLKSKANFIIFPTARRYSELLSRPQMDRIVVRNGKPIHSPLPSYEELDYIPNAVKSGQVPFFDVKYDHVSGAVVWKSSVCPQDTGCMAEEARQPMAVKTALTPRKPITLVFLLEWIVFILMSSWILQRGTLL